MSIEVFYGFSNSWYPYKSDASLMSPVVDDHGVIVGIVGAQKRCCRINLNVMETE